jgi:hypothetical protein
LLFVAPPPVFDGVVSFTSSPLSPQELPPQY